MKICPKCQKTYNDDALNFCLDDGAVLNQVGNAAQSDDSLPATVMISPRDTSPGASVGGQPQHGWAQEQKSEPTWGQVPQPAAAWGTGASAGQQGQASPAKSKTWMWVLGILAGVVVVCGGGLVGLIAFMANVDTSDKSENKSEGNKILISQKSPGPSKTENFEKIDMSKWTETNQEYATAEYNDGELLMGTKQAGYYYVLVTQTSYKTENAVTRLTVANPDDKASRLGYGLIFHSNPTPLTKGYGFLIDADKGRYRVVKHAPGKETEVVKWKKSDAINGGTEKNVLEIRDKNGKFELYINGELVESMTNTDGYSGGVPGIYSGDGIQIAFSDLELGK